MATAPYPHLPVRSPRRWAIPAISPRHQCPRYYSRRTSYRIRRLTNTDTMSRHPGPATGLRDPRSGMRGRDLVRGIHDPGYGIRHPGCGIRHPGCGIRHPRCGIRDPGPLSRWVTVGDGHIHIRQRGFAARPRSGAEKVGALDWLSICIRPSFSVGNNCTAVNQ